MKKIIIYTNNQFKRLLTTKISIARELTHMQVNYFSNISQEPSRLITFSTLDLEQIEINDEVYREFLIDIYITNLFVNHRWEIKSLEPHSLFWEHLDKKDEKTSAGIDNFRFYQNLGDSGIMFLGIYKRGNACKPAASWVAHFYHTAASYHKQYRLGGTVLALLLDYLADNISKYALLINAVYQLLKV